VFSACPFILPSVLPFICYRTCERDILKANELMLMPIGIIDPWVMVMIRSTLEVRGLMVKVT